MSEEKAKVRDFQWKYHKDQIEGSAQEILEALGVDIKNEHFKGTSMRVANMYEEICWGCFVDFNKEVEDIMSSQFTFKDDQIVGAKSTVWTLCPHHLLPAKLRVNIAYLPAGTILGLSKLHRLSSLVASVPSCQEELASKIADLLMKYLKPKGVMVAITGIHMCTHMRGVKDSSMIFYNSAVRGVFLEDPNIKAEALALSEKEDDLKW
jgi:GTP cyclohydrolase I